FLTAIQRFTLSDWGFDLELDPSIPRRHFPPGPDGTQHGSATTEFKLDDGFKIMFSADMAMLKYDMSHLDGWATLVFDVQSSTEDILLATKLY
ncbi:hypothetical protein FRC11_008963, partial [Ceratobasidium sp. 423]